MKKAIIDLGSSSTKLQIFEIKGLAHNLLFKKKFDSRLGEGLGSDLMITAKALERNVQVLEEISGLLVEHNVTTAPFFFSTEILRKARNADEVIEKLSEVIQTPVQVLTHSQEAELFWTGATQELESEQEALALDIGGGSIQVIHGTKNKISQALLFNTGAFYYLDNFLKHDPGLKDEFIAMEDFIEKQLQENLKADFGESPVFIHGSGDVLSLYREAGFKSMPNDGSLIHPLRVDLKETMRKYEQLKPLSYLERQQFFPSQPFFMNGVNIGLAYTLALGSLLNIEHELPSNISLLDGIIYLLKLDQLDDFLTKA